MVPLLKRSQVIQQDRLVHHTVEQLVEVPVQIPQEKIVQVPKITVQERWPRWTGLRGWSLLEFQMPSGGHWVVYPMSQDRVSTVMNPIASHFGSAQERQNVVHVEHVIEIPVPQTVEADCAGPIGKALQ